MDAAAGIEISGIVVFGKAGQMGMAADNGDAVGLSPLGVAFFHPAALVLVFCRTGSIIKADQM